MSVQWNGTAGMKRNLNSGHEHTDENMTYFSRPLFAALNFAALFTQLGTVLAPGFSVP
jgi:hypothetical protein